MFNSSILDLAIGMAFIYLLLSLIASTLQEAIASLLQIRPANLEHGIRSLFSGGTLADGKTPFVDAIYRHGLIMGLYREHVDADGKLSKKSSPFRDRLRAIFRVYRNPHMEGVTDPYLLPSYIPGRTFALALLDILKVQAASIKPAPEAPLEDEGALPGPLPGAVAPASDPLNDIGDYLRILCDRQKTTGSATGYAAAEAMLSLLRDAQDIDSKMPPIEKFRCHLENWYNDSMDRASGWYKKYTQNVLLIIGLILAIGFNVDSINVGKTLWFDKDVRANLITAAGKYVEKNTPGNAASETEEKIELDKDKLTRQMSTTVKAFNEVSRESLLPVGWHYQRETYEAYRHNLFHPGEWIINPARWVWSDIPNWNWPRLVSGAVGWLITALALSLGAPFWFDILNKFMVVRSTVKPSEKSRTEASKDAT